jgi:hypothetical protein
MTNVQFLFAILLPTVTALIGIMVNKNDNGIIHADLRDLRTKVSEMGEFMARLEAK